jgi:hypothetical protein
MNTIDISKYMVDSARSENWQPMKLWLLENVGPLKTVQGSKAIGKGWELARHSQKTLTGAYQDTYFVIIEDELLALAFKLIWS